MTRRFAVGVAAVALVACGGHPANTGPFTSQAAAAQGTSTTAAPSTTAPTASAPASAPAPTTTPPALAISGWLPYWTASTSGDTSIDANTGRGLDEVNPFGIGLQRDGSLAVRSGTLDPARIARILARGGEVIPTVYDVHDRDALKTALASAAARARAIAEIADLAARPEFAGVDLDLEHAGRAGRDAFTRFVQDVAVAVHARGKLLVVTVPGKRADTPNWTGYDYAALGAVADRFRIMTYGYSGTWTAYPGGPIAPVDWIERVLTYAVSVVPPAKIDVGIPFYGYDWPADGSTIRSVTVPRARTLSALRSASAVDHVAARGESRFTYTDSGGVAHTVWYTDAVDAAAKAATARRFGCRGVAIWALGYGDDAVWDALRQVKNAPTP